MPRPPMVLPAPARDNASPMQLVVFNKSCRKALRDTYTRLHHLNSPPPDLTPPPAPRLRSTPLLPVAAAPPRQPLPLIQRIGPPRASSQPARFATGANAVPVPPRRRVTPTTTTTTTTTTTAVPPSRPHAPPPPPAQPVPMQRSRSAAEELIGRLGVAVARTGARAQRHAATIRAYVRGSVRVREPKAQRVRATGTNGVNGPNGAGGAFGGINGAGGVGVANGGGGGVGKGGGKGAATKEAGGVGAVTRPRWRRLQARMGALARMTEILVHEVAKLD